MARYDKPVLTFEEQIALLKRDGLRIDDERRMIRHLSNINYFRLCAYMRPFRQIVNKEEGNFKEGTSWDDIYDLYRFDRKFRLLIFDAIERIEVALRTQIVYQLGRKHGAHWQDKSELFKVVCYVDKKTGEKRTYCLYNELQKHINGVWTDTSCCDSFKRYSRKYSDPKNPPSWICMELMYFNELSKICKYLSDRQDVVGIAEYFGIQSEKVFCSWLHAINYVRNICAHHARLWNIRLSIQPEKFSYKGEDKIWLSNEEVDTIQSSRIYYFLCVILYLLQTVNPNSKFRKHFFDLLEEYPNIDVGYMGFPKNWREHPLWQK